ncbi:DUF1559 family PulG-like putative transporter [Singulisphaera acidiphila]|uniref:Prepilin-type N-terminal cleavage/methylation domain-containing protein n=1 Tax=Singulisphaera acidiphila (strain ATCC BAA-1392 / DSM 18658 / VKM B-2454 / MOB10) TaxID=886293 RepID=L0DAF9_SINAD|nr:DUF1559 domain-containing protein [Singulisphaera acidiphila]AGA25818.1 prepilin-type N-terminal cleavage/methylation domain-containing protein [Singulisphaera acidiphila DSM 18658]
MSTRKDRDGFSLVEVIIVLVVLAIFVLVLAMRMPRQREVARRAACQKNLMQIGVALLIYERSAGHLPVVPALGTEASRHGSPLRALLEELSVPDLRDVTDPEHPPVRAAGFVAREQRVPGFICPSDPNATAGFFPATISYRANAGDTPDGQNGAFSPGRKLRLADVEAGDGLEFTAAFSERLVGTNRPTHAPANYAEVAGPILANGCPPLESAPWKGDAGASWYASSWQSTLYQHAITPNAAPSCIAQDQRSAEMGASSGHLGTVNVLILDGSVRTYSETVDPQIWSKLATPHSAGPVKSGSDAP